MKKYKDRGLYIYEIGDKQKVVLCPDCNMNLAGEINRQMAIEVFLDTPSICGCNVYQKEMDKREEEIFNKLKGGEVKDVKRRRKETGRKKSKD